MTVERIPITDRATWLKLRERDITASAAAALLGVHPHISGFGLWALKTGAIAEDPEMSPAMRRGLMLEGPAIALLREERPNWRITKAHQYFRDPSIRLGATPDAYAVDPERGTGIIQVKTVESSIFRSKWRDPDTREVALPLWIAVQAIVEAHLTGRRWACVAALSVGFGVDLHVIDVPLHPGVIERVRAAVVDFWRMVDEGRRPDPDYARDGTLLETLYYQDNGEEIDLTGENMLPELADERERLSAEKSGAEKRLREIKAEFIAKLGPAQAGRLADGRLVTAKTIVRKAYSVEEATYRDIRIKGKAA